MIDDIDFPVSFCEWLKRRRKELDLTQAELAERASCSIFALRKIEAGDRRPSKQLAGLLAQALEIPPEDQQTFIKTARGELSIERLPSLERTPPRDSRPAFRSDPVSGNLPRPLTPFIGREPELDALNQLLCDPACSLLTIIGPGGIGKTRLAIEVATRQRDIFPDGVWFVPLAPLSSSEYLIPAIADALRFRFQNPATPQEQLLNYLHDKSALLVLDNVEHLLDGGGLFVEILKSSPQVKLLVTSRERVNLLSEWVFEIQGLPVPPSDQAEQIEEYSSAALFLQSVRRIQAGFEVQEDERQWVVRICQVMEGMPLGIELAAAWVGLLSCEEVAREIERSVDFLTATARDIPQRHRSIRAVFDSSWSLLSNQEQGVMQSLSVFRGGFTRQAAEMVAGATLPLLLALKDKSLLRYSQTGRYDLHELIRQYAHEQLIESGELDSASSRHLDFFLAMAEEYRSKLRGAEQIVWLNRLGQDHDNLRAALEWSLRHEEESGKPSLVEEQDVNQALRLAGALYLFWMMRVHYGEGRKWLQRALAQAAQFPNSPERLRALDAAARLAAEQADTRAARELAEESLALARDLGHAHSTARALYMLGLISWKQKDFAGARTHCGQALERFRELGDKSAMADALKTLGRIAMNQHDLETAQSCLEECLAIRRVLEDGIESSVTSSDLGLLAYLNNDFQVARSYLEGSLGLFREAEIPCGIEMTLNRLGDIARCENDYAEAERCYTESLKIFQEAGDKDEIPSLLHNLGFVANHCGEYSRALELFKGGLEMHEETGNQAGIAECLAGIGAVLTSQGQAERGARLFGAAEILRGKAGATLWPANRMEYERSLTLLRDSLDDITLAAAWAAGGAVPIQQVITEALRAG